MVDKIEFKLSIFDILLALIIQQYFQEFVEINTVLQYFFFFFTFGVLIFLYYEYKDYHRKMEKYENVKPYTLLNLILDIPAIFFGFQLVIAINSSVTQYFMWFSTLFYVAALWHFVHLIMYRKLEDLRVKNTFNFGRDLSVAIILTFILILGKDISEWGYFWIVVSTFLVLSVLNVAILSWDRINPEIEKVKISIDLGTRKSEKRREFSISIVDIIFALIIQQIFVEYIAITSLVGYFFFFFTFSLLIYYFFDYRNWQSKLEQYENIKTHTLPTLILNIEAIFIIFQLVVTINISISLYYIWFVIMLYNGFVWHIIHIILFYKLKDLRIQNIFNMIRDIFVAMILTLILIFGKDLTDWKYFWIILITFLVMTMINISFQSWDRFNPHKFGDL
jgi:hypothetical protein